MKTSSKTLKNFSKIAFYNYVERAGICLKNGEHANALQHFRNALQFAPSGGKARMIRDRIQYVRELIRLEGFDNDWY